MSDPSLNSQNNSNEEDALVKPSQVVSQGKTIIHDNKNLESSKPSDNNNKGIQGTNDDDNDRFDDRQEELIAGSFFGIIVLGLFISIIGGIWAIGDIFSTDKFGSFLQLSLQSKIFIIGIILVGIFFLSIFFVVLYRRGKQSLRKMLFKQKPKEKDREEYLPAKIIAGGGLVSIFVIFFGLIFTLIEYMVQHNSGTDTSGVWSFMDNLTGGQTVFLVGLIILMITGLILGFFFLWQNGYYWVMNWILDYNNKFSSNEVQEFSDKQKLIGRIIFSLFVVDVIAIVAGIVWAIIDATSLNWGTTFKTYPFGIQFSIFGLFGTGLFILLIFAMMLYKWGNNIILTAIFVKFDTSEIEKDNLSAKIITVGMLSGIFLIFLAIVVWLFSIAAGAITGEDIANIFVALGTLSRGLAMMAYSLLIGILAILVLLFIFAFHNGYYYAARKVAEMENELDKELDKAAEITKKMKKKQK